jgi:uncharacterized membrane protein YqaE (UPF0057 family)
MVVSLYALTEISQVTPQPASQMNQIVSTTPSGGHARDMNTGMNVLIAVVCPPMAIYLIRGCGWEVALCIFLWAMTGIVSSIQALYIVLRSDEDFMRRRTERKERKRQGKVDRKLISADKRAARKAAKVAKKLRKSSA